MNSLRRVVTFDLFSALIDSRVGRVGGLRRRSRVSTAGPCPGSQLYDAWDPRNKAAQRDCARVGAVAGAGAAARSPRRTPTSGSTGDPAEAVEALVRLDAGVAAVARRAHRAARPARAGGGSACCPTSMTTSSLSTAAAPLVDHDVALTSERLGVYKPHAAIYRRAVDAARAAGARARPRPATCAVRSRPGSRPSGCGGPATSSTLDGPRPTHEVTSTIELPGVLAAAL